MKKHRKEAILISFLKEKEKYKKIAEYIVHLIQDDPSSPDESLHTVIYRIKDELRLIEKINTLNERMDAGARIITEKNYQEIIGDLLGVRIICLRLSDVEKIETYLKLLSEENILDFVEGPDPKKSFLLPVDPVESIPDGAEPRYTGYSSIHYKIKLGENSDVPPALKNLRFELQLRTILEEAWSEIDHKYRYMRSRSGIKLPEHIHVGFYNLSAYLQVAAHQAEYLCRLSEAHSLIKIPEVKGNAATPCSGGTDATAMERDETCRKLSATEIETNIEAILGVKVTLRTLLYIEKRLGDLNFEETRAKTLQQLFAKKRLLEFKTIFQEIFNIGPFMNAKEQSIDVINALNFAIFYELQGKKVAQEGLRVILRWRKDRMIG
ncbi:MAG: RelA/SpoT domain-containing protein [Desulfatirhabdiaceae bacterium]|nr:RelA/SpoT domain-containing protein [Desulfatirhabdiaceae bacterium]